MRHTALGALFAQQMDEVLALAAPVPENCTLAGQEGWMLWAAIPSDTTAFVIVKGAANLVQHARGRHHRRLDFAAISNSSKDAGSFEAMLCNSQTGSARALEVGEVVACFSNGTQESGCNVVLDLPVVSPAA